MFLIGRLPKIPPGTISIYMNRIYNPKQYNQHNIRFFQSSASKSTIFSFNTSRGSLKDADSAEKADISGESSSGADGSSSEIKLRWFYATDVPNWQPAAYNYKKTAEPKKFLPFSEQDSDRLEAQFQALKSGDAKPIPGFDPHVVPVQEDRLFECDLQKFELKPIYWEGAIYEVRRGIWFDKDHMPVKQDLADELETAYFRIEPFNKNIDEIEDTMSLTQKLSSAKTAVFTKGNSVYLLDQDSHFTSFQVKYLTQSVIPPLLPVEKYTRGYKADALKEKKNKKQEKAKVLDKPKQKNEIENDYSNKSDRFHNNRDIDHLVICVHGVGQVLGTQYESVNFIHTINMLRQTMKKVFKENETLQKIAYPDSNLEPENCKVQVLPIVWRHNVDLNSSKKLDDKITLSDITIDGLRPLRNMLGDIVLDVLLYYEPHYMNQILDEVAAQANAVYDKYLEKNPNFKGKVSLVGHSLGSAICFDLLCRQPSSLKEVKGDPRFLKFQVENFFAVGSPIGVFNLLKNSQIKSRSPSLAKDNNIKSPKVKNFYNVFHPCDPIAYRIEPLISKEFADYKPAMIPFASKNIDAQIQNLSQIGDELTSKVIQNLNTALSTITPATRKKVETVEQPPHESTVTHAALDVMTKFNYSGRIDYSLPASIFDISIVSAINSHISYFEEPNVAGFLARELLLNKKIVKDKKVLLIDEDDEEYFTVDEEETI